MLTDEERKIRNQKKNIRTMPVVHFSISKDAESAVRAYAEHASISRSEIYRNAVSDYLAGGSSVGDELKSMRRQLSGIANNLNQITRIFHMNGEPVDDLENALRDIEELRDKVRKSLKKVRR